MARMRLAGYDVLQLAGALPIRALDDEVLRQAREGRRILVTNDKDFGELTFLQRKAAAGIVLLRMPTLGSNQKAERLVEALRVVGDRLAGAMVVVTERAIRRRSLPELGS